MKSPLTRVRLRPTRLLLAAAAAAVLGVALLPPVLAPGYRMVVMDVLSPLCHQLPGRSFALAGVQMGLCHRCSALLGGMAAALLLPLAARRLVPPAALLVIALAPLVLDWGLDLAGLWSNTVLTRVLTGLWAGGLLGLLIGGSAAESRSRHTEMVPDP